mmetsp:Transcript_3515/g.7616  ORF Transcript_3515/g.7616 Transcript_3515/m.7616 type:complete len:100 (-) Transcript_3515:2865-3164(-)
MGFLELIVVPSYMLLIRALCMDDSCLRCREDVVCVASRVVECCCCCCWLLLLLVVILLRVDVLCCLWMLSVFFDRLFVYLLILGMRNRYVACRVFIGRR